MKYVSNSREETKAIAESFVAGLTQGKSATVVALYGDLGSGKTTFSQFVGEVLGVRGPIVSPTFLIERIYELHGKAWQHLVHIDAYRLERDSELLDLGWREIIKRPENIVLVEWADKIESILPESAYHIVLSHHGEESRGIEVKEGREGEEGAPGSS